MGAAGDMLTGALLELMPDKAKAADRLNAIGIPGVKYEAMDDEKCGVCGTHVRVTYKGEEEVTEDVGEHEHVHDHHLHDEHEHDHGHHHEHEHHHHEEHDHGHEHSHTSLRDVEAIIEELNLPKAAKENALGVYKIIAEAESHAHGVPTDEVHFHEVGQMDAIADISAVCLLMHKIGAEAISVSDIHLGCGHVHCAHGVMDVPTPATAYIAEDLPTYSDGLKGELCTPTGVALLKYFGTEFGGRFEELVQNASERIAEKPEGTAAAKIGRGTGRKDFERPNCVSVILVED